MAKHIEVIARGVCIRANHVLVCRNLEGGYCYLPGGHVEFGETSQDALAREMVEEAGVETTIGALLCVDECRFEQPGKSGKLKARHEINLVYEMDLLPRGTKPTVVSSLEPEIGFDWVEISGLAAAGFKPASTLRALSKFLPRGKI